MHRTPRQLSHTRARDAMETRAQARAALTPATISFGHMVKWAQNSDWRRFHSERLRDMRQERNPRILGLDARRYSSYTNTSCNPDYASTNREPECCVRCNKFGYKTKFTKCQCSMELSTHWLYSLVVFTGYASGTLIAQRKECIQVLTHWGGLQ